MLEWYLFSALPGFADYFHSKHIHGESLALAAVGGGRGKKMSFTTISYSKQKPDANGACNRVDKENDESLMSRCIKHSFPVSSETVLSYPLKISSLQSAVRGQRHLKQEEVSRWNLQLQGRAAPHSLTRFVKGGRRKGELKGERREGGRAREKGMTAWMCSGHLKRFTSRITIKQLSQGLWLEVLGKGCHFKAAIEPLCMEK